MTPLSFVPELAPRPSSDAQNRHTLPPSEPDDITRDIVRRGPATEPQARRLGRVIAIARRERGWSQLVLAEASGTTQARIAALERGSGNPKLDTLGRVLHALELELAVRAHPVSADGGDDPRLAAFPPAATPPMPRPFSESLAAHRRLLIALAHHRVRAILVGGVAAIVHGVQQHTDDLDVLYARDAANLERLSTMLRSLRAHVAGTRITLELVALRAGLNFALDTWVGALDLYGVLTAGGGGGRYEDLIGDTQHVACFGVELRVLDGDALARVARAVGRPSDLQRAALLNHERIGGPRRISVVRTY